MKDTKFLAECSCGGYHYVQIDEWDLGKGEVVLAFVQPPMGFWELIKRAWKHRDMYVTDIVLDKRQQKLLVESLKE